MPKFTAQITNSREILKATGQLVREFTIGIANVIDWERELKPFLIEKISRSDGFIWLGGDEARGELGVAPESSENLQETVLDVINKDKISVNPTARTVQVFWGNYEILYGIDTLHFLTSGLNLNKKDTSPELVSWVKWVDEGVISTPDFVLDTKTKKMGRSGLNYLMVSKDSEAGKGQSFWKIKPRSFITDTIETKEREINKKIEQIIRKFWRDIGKRSRIVKNR